MPFRLILVVGLGCVALLTGCSGYTHASGQERHYALSGKVVALNAQDNTATIDAAAIPNFMEAMTMEYPVKPPAELKALRVGDRITATVNVHEDDGYDLTNIKVQSSGK
jgi:Cu/Ag efflux protein CusF